MVEFHNSPTWDATARPAKDDEMVAWAEGTVKKIRYRPDLETEVEVRRQYGPVDIDDGPYRCDIEACPRLRGFRSEECLDRHKRLYH